MNRDAYQTPRELFAVLNSEFNFKSDVCASKENSLCHFYITEELNCLTQNWFTMCIDVGDYVWMNPPYSDIGPFVKRAAEMASKGVGTVMLVMMDQSVGWYREAIKTCQEVRLIIGGRLAFIDPSTGKPAAGNNKGSMFLIWHPFGRTKVQYSHIERDELLAAGRALLEQQKGEPVINPEKLPEPELSTNALQLPDHIVDANEMVGTHINEGANVCVSATDEKAEQIATKCVEESGTDIDGGTNIENPEQRVADEEVPPALPSKFTIDLMCDYIRAGKLPFDGVPMALTLKLYEMFGEHEEYTLRQIRTAIIAIEEPGMVAKSEPETEQTHNWPVEVYTALGNALTKKPMKLTKPQRETVCSAINQKILNGGSKDEATSVAIELLQGYQSCAA